MIKKKWFYIIYVCFCIQNSLFSQEILTGMSFNEDLIKSQKPSRLQQKYIHSFIFHESISLPFVEDFSNYTGYPDTALWIDNYAFVNQSFGLCPPSIGVATLDAIDHQGRVYKHGGRSAFAADTLTSRPIRLDSIFSPIIKALTAADSIYFSFFYQPGGGLAGIWERLGDAPENGDSLVLEFGYYTGDTVLSHYTTISYQNLDTVYQVGDTIFSPCDNTLFQIATQEYEIGDFIDIICDSVIMLETKWQHVWSSEGMTLTAFKEKHNLDSGLLFHQIMIPIRDSVYFNKGFQFRFRNYASLEYSENEPTWASNVDFWNIDYVRLDRARSISDTLINDIAFSANPGSILEEYQVMPWKHFDDKKLRVNFENLLVNLSKEVKNTSYQYKIVDENNNEIDSYDGGAYNLSPVYVSGFQSYASHAKPKISTKFPTTTSDSVEYRIIHIFKEAGSGDQNPKNDTAIFVQRFHNYFAYDDGTPEAGYTVVNVYNPYKTSMALGFTLTKTDTLRAVAMYINHVLNDENSFGFTLNVWADDRGKPGKILYSEKIEQSYSDDLYGFQLFYLEEPVILTGNFYIGYEISTKNYLNVGFDQNTNSSKHVFYNMGNEWHQSFLAGTPMLRPFVGKKWDSQGVEEYAQTSMFTLTLYPNPAKDVLHVQFSEDLIDSDFHIEIFTLMGQRIYNGHAVSTIDLTSYKSGVYILRASDTKTKQTAVSKFVVNK